MRAVRLPAAMAVCAEPLSHHIVTAVNSSASFQQYRREKERAGAAAGGDAAGQYRFRLNGLLPADWASLLEMCRGLSHPQKAFNFSSPGDIGVPQGQPPGVVVENGAYMHVVERAAGDFVPNNMIYHQLQRYTINEGDGGAAKNGFRQLVKDAQAQLPHSPSALLMATSPSATEKAALDPLAGVEDAMAKSAANLDVNLWDEDKEGTAPRVFTFYPFPCLVAASIPYRSPHFCVLVNLKPIVPNHLMVVPLRCVGTIHALTGEEVADWGRTVALTVRVLNEVRRRELAKGSGTSAAAAEGNFSVAIQQGELAGQTVPHLHTHIIPFDPSGKLAGEPESEESEQQRRAARTVATMKAETDAFKPIFQELEKTL